jgi:signal transduction histidine kinase
MPSVRPAHPTHTHGSWEQLENRLHGVLPALLLFVLVYLPAIVLDHLLGETPGAATVLRPSIGLLLVVLWFSRASRWPAFLVIHLAASLLVESWLAGTLDSARIAHAVLPGAVAAIVGAVACRQLLRKPLEVQVSRVPLAMVGVVTGALAGATVASLVPTEETMHAQPFLHVLTAHAVEFSLGALTTGPVVLTWMQQLRFSTPELALRSRRELTWISVWIVAPILMGWFLLSGARSSLLPIPLVVGPALIFASLRLPPRWAVTLAALFVLPFSILATSREAPYSVADPEVRIGLQQMLAGIFVVVPFILSVGIAQLRMTMSRLRAEQEKLQTYANRVLVAEEKARRSTAIDLHDGIGQTLAGMQMMVDVARAHPPRSLDPVLADLSQRLREIQDHTRRMITDLSPPGLYELGLGAALQWLAIYMHEQEGLRVALSCEVEEAAIPEGTRVLVFRITRELLRNVARHSGVRESRVEALGDMRGLKLVVSDAGRGFDPATVSSRGFGLWSVAEQIRDHGGRFDVVSARGEGARFELSLPLRPA